MVECVECLDSRKAWFTAFGNLDAARLLSLEGTKGVPKELGWIYIYIYICIHIYIYIERERYKYQLVWSHVLLQILHMFKPSCRPMFKPPSLGSPGFPSKPRLVNSANWKHHTNTNTNTNTNINPNTNTDDNTYIYIYIYIHRADRTWARRSAIGGDS